MEIFPDSWMRFFLFLAGLYLCVIFFVWLFQSSLLYIPGDDDRDHSRYMGWHCWPDKTQFHGYISDHPPEKIEGTIIVWHGNAGTALDRGYFMDAFQKRNYRVILMEYPGYGDRPGKPGEAVFLDDSEAAVKIAFETFEKPFIFVGESLGNGVASAMAARFSDHVKGLIMITPWATLPDLAQSLYPFLPARYLTRDTFDNIANVSRYPGPVAIIMAAQDQVIPNVHTKKLVESIPEPKKLWIFNEAGHNNWPSDPGENWWNEVLEFIRNNSCI